MPYTEFLKVLSEGLDSVGSSATQNTREMNELIDKVKLSDHYTRNRQYKYFWGSWSHSGSKKKHDNFKGSKDYGKCCFTDIIGRPTKTTRDGRTIETEWMPYQKLLWQILHERKHIWIKKSRGLGLSTYLLYVIAYKCITEWTAGDRVVIITGIRIETAADLIRRLKLLFQKNFPELYNQLTKQKDTVCILNGVIVEAYPAGHVDSVRGIDRCKFIFIDEGDWFSPSESKEVRSVVEGFIGKPNSDPTIVFVSTPNRPLGLFQQIEQEQNSIYYKMFLSYQYGLDGEYPIYDIETIEEARKSPDFPREYELQYIGVSGGTFSELSLQKCQELGTELETLPVSKETQKVIALDPAWGGGSNFGIVALEYLKDLGKFRVIVADEYHRPHINDILDIIWNMKKELGGVSNIYCDAASAVLVQSLKRMFNEDSTENHIKTVTDSCKKYNIPIESRMFIVPLSFSTLHKTLLQQAKWITELTDDDNDGKAMMAIHPRYEKLVTGLRTSVSTEYTLDKSATSFNDIVDSYRMCCYWVKRRR